MRSVAFLCVAVVVGFAAPARADVTLAFSEFSSNPNVPPGDLSAAVTFQVTGSQLTITLSNDNFAGYDLIDLFFNSSSDLTGLSVADAGGLVVSILGSGVSQGQAAPAFGLFNWQLSIDLSTSVPSGSSATVVLDYTHAGTLDESEFVSFQSGTPPGTAVLGAITFYAGPFGGPENEYVTGGTNTVAGGPTPNPVPTPPALAMFATGLAGLAVLRRRAG